MAYENVIVETPADGVGLIRLNRPKALNALNEHLIDELFSALEAFEKDDNVGCIVITGNEKAFAAGADIKYFASKSMQDIMAQDEITDWSRMRAITKPIIAAVSGYALGGGCELAMACDMIVAGESAVFGQPEISLGVLPGAGGTQRLTRVVGKAIAMEMILADRKLSAEEAAQFGLVNYVVPDDVLIANTVTLASKIASMPRVAVRLARDAVNKAHELSLTEGLQYEKRNFYLTFGTEDKVEGMDAFINKRKPQWKNR